MHGTIYTEGDWTYIVEEDRDLDVVKNWHELYYKGENVTNKVRWFANISPYSIATREQFNEAINELKLQFWLTDGKRDANIKHNMKTEGANMYKLIDNDANINGTHLQGHIKADYEDLVKAFGEPTYDSTKHGESDKVHTQWALEFENEDGDYVVATIYDWKEDSPYTSRVGLYNWHIGGNGFEAVSAVYDSVDLKEVADA